MLPKSSDTSGGAISLWQWIKMGWNYMFMPQFNPLKVSASYVNVPNMWEVR